MLVVTWNRSSLSLRKEIMMLLVLVLLISVAILCVYLGRLLEQIRFFNIMSNFFETEEQRCQQYTDDFVNGVFYLNDYLKNFY